MKTCRLLVMAVFAFTVFVFTSFASSPDDYHFSIDSIALSETSGSDDSSGGIREDIPAKYVDRYQAWKNEFLATESGREQWNRYATDPLLKLTITVTRDNAEGATTGKYKWNENGQLIAATIVLGYRLDEGYPNPIYFPVMNSLVPTGTPNDITNRGQIESVARGVLSVDADEPVVTVLEVQHGRGIESVHVVNCELARQKLEFLTGSTGMFTFSMITGVKNGWLDAKVYGPAARKAWLGLVNQLDQDANVKDVCVGTNKGFTVQYYLDRERRVGDLHGQAPLLWSATALLR